jgi:SAM-dependent methyltransferase
MRKHFNREFFENLHGQSSDPWSYMTSSYERNKYDRTLEVLTHRRYHRVLEAGCSIGVFTSMLAPLCDELLAVDISEKAVVAARKRLANFPQVRVERLTLPEETPEGPFDLIIASEVLYYWPRDIVLVALQRFEEVLAPGGAILAVHERKSSWRRRIIDKVRPLFLRQWILKIKNARPLMGDEVHELLLKHTRLTNTVRLVKTEYRLDLFEGK